MSKPKGMTAFIIVWLGQIVSQIGSAMTAFGISIWLFQQTGQATTLTWAMVAFMGPATLLSPIAGTIVDRGNRKLILIASDLVAGITTIVMLILLLQGDLQIWHIYLLNFVNGSFSSLQWPAFSAAITMMVDKEHYARTSGMMQLGDSASNIFAPAAAAAFLSLFGLQGILIFDIVTFSIAVLAILPVLVPQPPVSAESQSSKGSFWAETKYGFTYILERRSLLGLQLVFMGINLFGNLSYALMIPMILARTANNEIALGSVQTVGAIGGVVGGLLLGVWGGPKKRTHGVLGGMILSGLSTMLLGIFSTVVLWAVAAFFMSFFLPFVNGSNQAIWQSKVPPDLQGRVFSVRRTIAQFLGPVSTAAAGPLADNIFEPAMREGGSLVNGFSWLVGSGVGSGMGLMILFGGAASVIVALIGYTSATVRDAESLLPDHDATKEAQYSGGN